MAAMVMAAMVLAVTAAVAPAADASPALGATPSAAASVPGQAPAPGTPPAAGTAHSLRASAPAFGLQAEVEVRDLPGPEAEAALRAALAEIAGVERLVDAERPDSAVGALNAAAGRGPQKVEARVLAALGRALDICLWSDNRNGPLGAEMYRLWGLGPRSGQGPTRLSEPPAEDALARAAELAECGRLSLDPARGTATLAAGSRVDLSGFAQGLAVDRAVEALRGHGAPNGQVRVGSVWRAFGGGLDGKGWWVTLPGVPGAEGPPERVRLRDQSLAVAAREDHPLQVGDATLSPYLNQRTGRPPEGIAVLATLAVTDLAIDAQALAVTLAITGSRQGQLLMGSIRPRPSVLWLQGNGSGPPLAVDYRWAELAKR